MRIQPKSSSKFPYRKQAAVALALALCLGVAARPQEQRGAQQQNQGQQQAQLQQPAPQPQEPQAKPKYPPQDADKPPYSKDHPASRGEATPGPPNQSEARQPQTDQPSAMGAASQLPEKLIIPAGTILLIRTNDFLSSDRNQIGDQFTALLEQPVVVNGWVVARRGQTLIGQVKAAQKAGRVRGVSQLGLELTDMSVVSGQQVPVLTELWKGSAGTSHGEDAATVANTAGLGAMIGAAADWARGAAIGAGVGAAAGIGALLLTRGHPTEIAPETPLSFQLLDPLTIDTTTSRIAFRPVSQEDFGRDDRRRPRLASGPYGRCGYYGPCYGYPFVGVYEYRRY
ncbi:MAG TPA: hypothetical protein VNB49_04140 [Candidatus Dormibacteraeota bacterium]|nr:hypothetical protein [Candidatus Dormibacteraeota bacterium]